MALIAWFKMNDKENDEIYKKLLDNGVDCIISNFPKQAKAYRDFYFSNYNKTNVTNRYNSDNYNINNEDEL